MLRRWILIVAIAAAAGSEPAAAQVWLPIRAPGRSGPQSLARPPEPATIGREKSGTGFFVDDAGHMLTARHAVEGCARLIVAKEGRVVAARTLALSPGFDLALIKAPKTLGLAAVFPRSGSASVNDLVFAAAYDKLPAMMTGGGVLANATVAPNAGEAGHLAIDSTVTFGASGAPVLDSKGLVEGVISRRTRIDRVLAVAANEAKAFLAGHGIRFDQDDRPQIAGGGSRANRAASISARVTCLQN
jgi:hypothetical protein